MRIIKFWILPLIISVGLFLGFRPVFAQFVEGQTISLSDFLKTDNVTVGSETIDGYTQVYYIINNEKVFITQGSVNSNLPATEGELIVYRKSLAGGDHIYLYDLLTDQTIQLSSSGHNTNPNIDGKNVVWEGQVEGNWQIFLYNGTRVDQLTNGEISINTDIEGDYVVYSTKDITGTWRSMIYSIANKKAKEITIGESSKYAKVENGKIFLGLEKEVFTLTAEDIFVLDLVTIPATASGETSSNSELFPTVTFEEIMTELQASPSGEASNF